MTFKEVESKLNRIRTSIDRIDVDFSNIECVKQDAIGFERICFFIEKKYENISEEMFIYISRFKGDATEINIKYDRSRNGLYRYMSDECRQTTYSGSISHIYDIVESTIISWIF